MAGNGSESKRLDELTDGVNRLADQLGVVVSALDEFRTDLNWLTRNPIRLAVTVDQSRCDASQPNTEAASALAETLQAALSKASGGHLDAVVSLLQEAHGHLLALTRGDIRAAIHADRTTAETERPPQRDSQGSASTTSVTEPGKLF